MHGSRRGPVVKVFAGNRHDATTVEDIVNAMEAKYGRAQRIRVMDRGMTRGTTGPLAITNGSP